MTSCYETERRRKIRVPVALLARYTVLRPRKIDRTGQTVNISRHGLLMTSEGYLSPGTPIRVIVLWSIGGGIVRTELYARGKVVRSTSRMLAVQFSSHEFRDGNYGNRRANGLARKNGGPAGEGAR